MMSVNWNISSFTRSIIDERFLKMNGKMTRLINNKQPFPLILYATQNKLSSSILPTISVLRKVLFKRKKIHGVCCDQEWFSWRRWCCNISHTDIYVVDNIKIITETKSKSPNWERCRTWWPKTSISPCISDWIEEWDLMKIKNIE